MTVGRIPNIEGGIQPTLLTTTGDIMYASSANNPARLGIGSSAQVLTVASGVPSWATPSAGGMTLLSTTSLSGTSTTISSINQTYTHLLVSTTNVTFSANASLRFKLNGTSTSSQINGVLNGAVSQLTNINPGNTAYAGDAQSTYHLLVNFYTQTAQIYNPVSFYGSILTAQSFNYAGVGANGASAAAVTSIEITTVAGTSTFSSGSVKIYGVK